MSTGSGEAGPYIGDSPHANAFVAGNDVSGNSLGIFYRHSQHAVIQFNTVHDNCIGIFAVSAPAPMGSGQIRYNTVPQQQQAGQRATRRRSRSTTTAAAATPSATISAPARCPAATASTRLLEGAGALTFSWPPRLCRAHV